MAFALQIPLKQDQWWEEVTVSKTELLKAGTATSSLGAQPRCRCHKQRSPSD